MGSKAGKQLVADQILGCRFSCDKLSRQQNLPITVQMDGTTQARRKLHLEACLIDASTCWLCTPLPTRVAPFHLGDLWPCRRIDAPITEIEVHAKIETDSPLNPSTLQRHRRQFLFNVPTWRPWQRHHEVMAMKCTAELLTPPIKLKA